MADLETEAQIVAVPALTGPASGWGVRNRAFAKQTKVLLVGRLPHVMGGSLNA